MTRIDPLFSKWDNIRMGLGLNNGTYYKMEQKCIYQSELVNNIHIPKLDVKLKDELFINLLRTSISNPILLFILIYNKWELNSQVQMRIT